MPQLGVITNCFYFGLLEKTPTRAQFSSLVGEEYQDSPFADSKISIPSVNPERTFLEKLFLLHEEFKRPEDKMRADRLSRHLYDIYKIGETEYIDTALNNKELYHSIVKHRSIFSKLQGVNYESHYPPNLNPIPPDHLMIDWEKDYKTMQEQMIHGESPDFGDLILSVKSITDKINKLPFPLNIEFKLKSN